MGKIKCDIRKVVAELNDPNSRNEVKAVAFATWNDGEETLNIRQYNTVDKTLLKGIGLTPDETEALVYALLSDPDVKYDREVAARLIKENTPIERKPVDITRMMQEMDEEDDPHGYGDYTRGEAGGIKLYPISRED
jgi:hypothetical protein